MSTSARIEALKKLTKDLEAVAKAEDAVLATKEARQNDPKDTKKKNAHRKAATELAELRMRLRSDNDVRDVAPGDVSLTPATVSK